jgi:hypothetical protein
MVKNQILKKGNSFENLILNAIFAFLKKFITKENELLRHN